MSAFQGRPGEETETRRIPGMLLYQGITTESCICLSRVIPSITNNRIIAKKFLPQCKACDSINKINREIFQWLGERL